MKGTDKNKDVKVTSERQEQKEDLLQEKQSHSDDSVLNFVPPDGGWGWIVCLAAFWANGTVFGVLNTFGILYVEMLEEFGDGDQDIAFKTSWVGALQISMTFFMSMFASILVDKIGIRMTSLIGALCSTTGMLASSFVYQLEVLYLTYGVLLGVGSALLYTPSIVILGHYFKKHLGIVNGLVSFGSAVFTIILPFVEKQLLQLVGLRYTMRVLSVLFALLLVCPLVWKPLYQPRKSDLQHLASTDSIYQQCCGSCTRACGKVINLSIWKCKGYKIWALSLGCSFLGYFIPFAHLPKHVADTMPSANAGILVMCLGVTSGISRLVSGKLSDLPSVNRIRLQQYAFVILGVATACIPFTTKFPVLVLIVLVMGVSDGCIVCLIGPIAFDLLGPVDASQGIGCLLAVMSIPLTAGPPLAGLAYDYMHTYKIAFLAAGIPPLIGACTLFLMPARSSRPKMTVEETVTALSRDHLDRIANEDEDKLSHKDRDAFTGTEMILIKSGGLNDDTVSKDSSKSIA